MLYVGMVFLSVFFILHWVDILIRYCRTPVLYNYIIFPAILHIFRVFSDIYVVWGIRRVMRRYHSLRREDTASAAVFALLVLLGVYQLCLLFALDFTWLGFADPGVINEISKDRSAFEVAFSAVMFIVVIHLAILDEYKKRFISHTNHYKIQLAEAMDTALIFLLIRSFCEIVIVGQLNRSPGHLTAILRARDVVYGLFSLPLMICIACALPENAPESHDPLVALEEDEIDRLTNSILQRLNEITENGRKTAPSMDSFLKAFEKYPKGINYPAQMIELVKLDEVRRLMYKYRKWTPIYKWEGPRPESETETPPESIGRMTGRTIRRVDAEDGTRELYYLPVAAVA